MRLYVTTKRDARMPTFACLIVVHLWITMQPFDLKNLMRGPAERLSTYLAGQHAEYQHYVRLLPAVSNTRTPSSTAARA